MKLAMAQEMRNIDKQAIEAYGIPEIILMENASLAIAKNAEKLVPNIKGKRICVLAGSGNNGGDAFAAARHLMNSGARVKIFFLGNLEHMSESARTNQKIAENMGISITSLSENRGWDKLKLYLRITDLIVDGLLGTGFKGHLRPDMERLINTANEAQVPILSIDIASGVEADTGNIQTVAIKATATITLGLPKWGCMFEPGRRNTGELKLDRIGIPASLLEDAAIRQELIDKALVNECIIARGSEAHKGSCGRILVIAGSVGMTGAAKLCSTASLRIGAGIVTLAIPESLNSIMEVKLTEAMTFPIRDRENPGHFGIEALDELLRLSGKYSYVLIGPGLGRDDGTQAMVREFIRQVDKPLLIDADAIYALRLRGELLRKCRHVPVLTPHLGEMSTLLGIDINDLKANLLEYSRMAASDNNAIMVVKSERTIIAYPDGRVFVTTVGNPGMATAGCGDVLAGTIAGLFAQTNEQMAPIAGVYLHGLAGDMAFADKGNGLLATDILENLPYALKKITE